MFPDNIAGYFTFLRVRARALGTFHDRLSHIFNKFDEEDEVAEDKTPGPVACLNTVAGDPFGEVDDLKNSDDEILIVD